jgi:hypothetical protein
MWQITARPPSSNCPTNLPRLSQDFTGGGPFGRWPYTETTGMRRISLAVALCGMLILAACSDQSRESPTEPSEQPEAGQTTKCGALAFPLTKVQVLIKKVFPLGALRLEAIARAGIIKLLWDTCKRAEAQKAAIAFIDWMNLKSSSLTGTQAQRDELVTLILNGVGVPVTVSSSSSGGFGVGFFDPTSEEPLLVETANEVALTEIPAHSFNQEMIITVSRKPDNSTLTNFDGNQFAPYWDYDAIRSSGTTVNADHVLQNGNTAAIVFCLLNSDFVTYPPPANRRIGHNPVQGAPGFPFEILEPIDLEEDRPDLAAELECENLAPTLSVGSSLGGGFGGFANAAWAMTGRYLEPLADALLLPQALQAATLGTLPPPIGGRAPSLTPFAVVEIDDPGVISNGTVSLGINPEGQLNVLSDPGFVGLRFGPTGLDGVAHACLCEGWGVAHPLSEVSGYANQSQSPNTSNLTVESFVRTATEATSVVNVGSTFRVRHHFRPIAATSNLYEIHVTVENTSDEPLSGVVYRRVVDWDVAPTPFSEFITVVRSASLTGVSTTNNGFNSADPLVPPGPIGSETPDHTGDFFNVGAFDHGALFDITLSTIFPGGTNTFVIYYGAAGNTADAKAALRSVGVAALSLARPNVSPFDGTPNTFVIGFSGIGGAPVEISEMEPPPGPSATSSLRLNNLPGPHPRNR